MLLVDTEEKCLIQDVELKAKIAKSRPHGEWLQKQVIIWRLILIITKKNSFRLLKDSQFCEFKLEIYFREIFIKKITHKILTFYHIFSSQQLSFHPKKKPLKKYQTKIIKFNEILWQICIKIFKKK